MKDFLSTVLFFLAIAVIVILQEKIGTIYTIIAVTAIFFLIIGIQMRLSMAKDKKEEDDYEKFLKDSSFEKYDKNLSEKETDLRELKLCNEFLKENPDNKHAFEKKAELCFKSEKYEDSLNTYEMLSQKYDERHLHVADIAKCYYALGEKTKALDMMNDNYKERKKNELYYADIAEMNKVAKEYDEAIKNYTLAIECDPMNFIFYEDRAEIYKILGQQDKYEADMEKFNELLGVSFDDEEDKNAKPKDNKSLKTDFKNLKP